MANQCNHGFINGKKRAVIYDLPSWDGVEGTPKDYIFHELLHLCMAAVMHATKKERREAEETLVQDLCKILIKEDS